MTSLDFLYIALGGGFLILVIFGSVMLLQLTLVLRDITKISNNAREISEKVKEIVLEPLKVLSEATASFGIIKDLIERIKEKYAAHMEDDDEELKTDKGGKDKEGFSVKKLGK